MATISEYQETAVRGIAAYLASDDPVVRTPALRSVAQAYVGAREHFFTADGEPDWTGRTHAYRTWVAETMNLANVPPAQRNTVRSAIAYHLSSVLRDRLSDEETQDLGLSPRSARERSAQARVKGQVLTHLFGGGASITDPSDVLDMYRHLATATRRIAPEAFDGMTPEQAAELRQLRREVEDRLPDLAGA